MIVGFTGTRKGMTARQRREVWEVLLAAHEAHHGDCVGADADFHDLCQRQGTPVVLHPPTNRTLRAFCEGAAREEPEAPYLVRDRHIVTVCHLLLAAPAEAIEPPPARGQGTWSTVRYARKVGRDVRVLAP
jgi:hypothetical protein